MTKKTYFGHVSKIAHPNANKLTSLEWEIGMEKWKSGMETQIS